MTNRSWVGGTSNNEAGVAANWSPTGAPAPGDTLSISTDNGTMNVTGNDLAGDMLVVAGRNDTLNLSGVTSTTINADNIKPAVQGSVADSIGIVMAGTNAVTYVAGSYSVHDGNASDGHVTIGPNSVWNGTFTLPLSAVGDGNTWIGSTLAVSGLGGAAFNNIGTSVVGDGAVISVNVGGNGSFIFPGAGVHPVTTLEFDGGVSSGQTVVLAQQDEGQGDILAIGDPHAFAGHVVLTDVDDYVDLKNLPTADSFTDTNGILSVYAGASVIDTLNITAGSIDVQKSGNDVYVIGGPGKTLGTELPTYAASVPPAGPPTNSPPPPGGSGPVNPPSPPAGDPPPPPPVAGPPPVPAPNYFTVTDTSNGQTSQQAGEAYSGPVAGLTNQYVNISSDNLNITSNIPNVFLHSGPGEDALNVQAAGGNNVLDGSTGSNFLVGGSGTDQFFLDDRNATTTTWDTVVNMHSGDNATIWGVTQADFKVSWLDNQGAEGHKGLTGVFDGNKGQPQAAVSLAGFTTSDLGNGKLSVSFGSTPDMPGLPGSNYMQIHAN